MGERSYVGGEWVTSQSPQSCPVVNPATEEVIAQVRDASPEDVDRAVAAAASATTAWGSLSVAERGEHLGKLAPLIETAAPELVELLVLETGVPITWVRDVHVGRLSASILSITSLADQIPPPHRIGNSLIVREPAGVVASISPWNYPLAFFTKVLPALMAGCSVVAKPSEVAPLSAYALTELIAQIGLPPGVLNVVFGSGPTTGAALAAHPGIDVLTFTGSERTGEGILRATAANITRPVLELGGKSASVVLDGAPFEQAIRKTLWNCYMNNGQVCGAQTRLVVPAGRMDDAAAIAADEASTYLLGDPADPATKLGPIVNARQYGRVRDFIQSGSRDGATLVCGGPDRPDRFERGYFVPPTVFSNVTTSMTIGQEEIFGPVLSILGYRSEDEAATIANDSRYGLSGAVWGPSDEEAVRFSRRLRTGQVQINAGMFNGTAPFGGFKHSGMGRENGIYGLLEYTEVKSLQLPATSSLLESV